MYLITLTFLFYFNSTVTCIIFIKLVLLQEWSARLDIERSKAIKCPSIHYQLAGTKKIQQELAREGAVERFVSDEKEAAKIRSVFAGQYSLDLVSKGRYITMYIRKKMLVSKGRWIVLLSMVTVHRKHITCKNRKTSNSKKYILHLKEKKLIRILIMCVQGRQLTILNYFWKWRTVQLICA